MPKEYTAMAKHTAQNTPAYARTCVYTNISWKLRFRKLAEGKRKNNAVTSIRHAQRRLLYSHSTHHYKFDGTGTPVPSE